MCTFFCKLSIQQGKTVLIILYAVQGLTSFTLLYKNNYFHAVCMDHQLVKVHDVM